jgi:hypothetical protein
MQGPAFSAAENPAPVARHETFPNLWTEQVAHGQVSGLQEMRENTVAAVAGRYSSPPNWAGSASGTQVPRYGLLLAEYVENARCTVYVPSAKTVSEPQCKYCGYWFNYPTCGHRFLRPAC